MGDFGPDFSTGVQQLSIYNEALGHLGERRLASLTEQREPRRVLDSYWSDVVRYCINEGLWRFAIRTAQIEATTAFVPQFGYNNAFQFPSDFVRVVQLSTSPQIDPPLTQYREEAGYWYANSTPLYARYISNDPMYGLNMGGWPQVFVDFVELRLAVKACYRITGSRELLAGADGLIKREERAKRVAKGTIAMDDPAGLPPVPFWVRARRGAYAGGVFIGSTGGSGGEN